MVEEEIVRKGYPIGHHGKPLHGGISMKTTIQILCTLPHARWMQFQIKTLAQHGTMPFQDCKQFIDFCDKITLEEKAKLSRFYMQNLSLTYLNVWDPIENLGDL